MPIFRRVVWRMLRLLFPPVTGSSRGYIVLETCT